MIHHKVAKATPNRPSIINWRNSITESQSDLHHRTYTIHRDHVLISLRDDINQYLSKVLIISERVNPESSSEIGLIKVISAEIPATPQTPPPWFHSWKLFRFGKLINPATCSGAYLCTWRIVPPSKFKPNTTDKFR